MKRPMVTIGGLLLVGLYVLLFNRLKFHFKSRYASASADYPLYKHASHEDRNGSALRMSPAWQESVAEFVAEREALYEQRKERIFRVCQSLWASGSLRDRLDYSRIVASTMIVERQRFNVAFCRNPKVASTTWFVGLRNVGAQEVFLERRPVPSLRALDEKIQRVVNGSTVSMVITRHPLQRLVSAYYDKMRTRLAFTRYDQIRRKIIAHYRGSSHLTQAANMERRKFPNETFWTHNLKTAIVRPSEFLSHVLDSLQGSSPVDPHWRPQHLLCPFCQMSFTVYGELEEHELDAKYFLLKSGLDKNMDPGVVLNPSHGGNVKSEGRRVVNLPQEISSGSKVIRRQREKCFWCSLPTWMADAAAEGYAGDLEMFGYDARRYLDGLTGCHMPSVKMC